MFTTKLKKHENRRAPCGSIEQSRRRWREWLKTDLGRLLAQEESEQIAPLLPTMFGYYLLQVGYVEDPSQYLSFSLIKNKIIVDNDSRLAGKTTQIVSLSEAMAIASDSVDVVILSHVLEFHPDPHHVLREVDRILVAEGRVIILGFNPWSLWGMRHLLSRWSGENAPWCGRFLSPFRVKDWFKLLGFDIEIANSFFHHLPVEKRWVRDNSSFMSSFGAKIWPAFGAAYLLVAKKRVSSLTRIPLKWSVPRRAVKPGLIETRDSTNARSR